MKTQKMFLFTRTPLHVGAGNSVGVVDSPIMRERHTKTPIIPGSSLKGVLADLWNDDENRYKVKDVWKRKNGSELLQLFGSDDDETASAGALLIGEARVLAFPLRSAKGGFAWITCPHALKKFARDTEKTIGDISDVDNETCLAGSAVVFEDKKAVVLEEYRLTKTGSIPTAVAEALKGIVSDPLWEPEKRLVIVSDELFSYFVENACEVVTRIRVNDDTGTVDDGALFNQEQVPSETLFYSVVACTKGEDCLGKLKAKVEACGNVLQIGGDATIGLGFCSVTIQ